MIKFCSLYSGSSGNCLFIHSKHTRLLIDAGVSCKKIGEALDSIGESISDIDAILVTHEHSDHIQGIGTTSQKFDIPVYANEKTWNAMEKQRAKIDSNNIHIFENDCDFQLNDLTIHPFSTPHDAANPCGFNIHNGNKRLSIATDLGHMNNQLISELYTSSFVFLEANYDPEILKASRYPYPLKQRISGPHGHLSNDTAGKTIHNLLLKKDLKEVMLGHLSKENNFPELAYQTVANQLIENHADLENIGLSVANRYEPSKIINL